MMYLGIPGQMIGVKCPTAQRVTTTDRYTLHNTLGGVVKAQAGPVGRRVWDIRLGQLTTPAEVGTLMDFAAGTWGPGPFWFLPVDAPLVNLMTPDAAACDPGSVTFSGGGQLLGSPPLVLGDHGVAAQSVWKTDTGTATLGVPAPVIPGQQVTGSAWVIGSGVVSLAFIDASGKPLGTIPSSQASWVEPQRLAVTTTAPRHAAAVHLIIGSGITQAARPAITWTNQPYEWGDGQGCRKAIVHQATRDVVKAWDNPRTGRWSDVSFVVQEVG